MARIASAVVALLVFSACASSPPLSVRPSDPRKVRGERQVNALSTGEPSGPTRIVLRRQDLLEEFDQRPALKPSSGSTNSSLEMRRPRTPCSLWPSSPSCSQPGRTRRGRPRASRGDAGRAAGRAPECVRRPRVRAGALTTSPRPSTPGPSCSPSGSGTRSRWSTRARRSPRGSTTTPSRPPSAPGKGTSSCAPASTRCRSEHSRLSSIPPPSSGECVG